MSEKLEELISLLYQDRLSQYGKRLLVENIEKLQKENEELHKEIDRMKSLDIYKLVEDWETGQLIPIQKIKDKIEELSKTKGDLATHIAVSERIRALQEILESEDSKDGEN
jgi:hypothetical protein